MPLKLLPNFARRRQRGATLPSFLLLLLLAALLAGGWFGWQQLEHLRSDNQRLQGRLSDLEQRQQQRLDQLAAEDTGIGERLETIETEQRARAEVLDNLQRGGQRNWLLNEAEALASLAQQRLLLTADLDAAERLLLAADKTLARLHDGNVLPARQALARDLDALRAAQQVDVQALVMQLGALQQRLATLAIPVAAQARTLEDNKTPPPADAGWWQSLLHTLPVTVRRQEAPLPLPLDAHQASSVRLYMDNCLQQAQLSLLQGKPDSYQQALAALRDALATWLVSDSAETRHLLASVDALQRQSVQQALPDIGAGLAGIRSLQAELAP